MYIDNNCVLSSAQAITSTAASTNVYDITGQGVGVVVHPNPGATGTVGEDIGIGDGVSPPQIVAIVGTAFTASGAATLQVQVEAAVDDGTGNPGTWQILEQTDTYAKTLLTAGQKIVRYTIPHRYPGALPPRFYRLNYVVATGPMTAGTVSAYIVTGIDATPAYPNAY